MKTKTVVEVTHKELVDLVIKEAKKAVNPGPGPVRVEFGQDENADVIASVTFEWGAKVNGE